MLKEKRPKILICSSDTDLSDSISMLFESMYDTECSKCENLIKKVQSGYDVLIIDVPMNEDYLLNIIKGIKRIKPEMPIILLYVYKLSNEELERNFRAYSDYILYKPIDILHLTHTIENLLIVKTHKQIKK